MTRRRLFVAALLLALLSFPPQWYPMPVRLKLTAWFGAAGFRALPASVEAMTVEPEVFCPPDPEGWRERKSIEGVEIGPSASCVADNPFTVAAFVRGTNNVSQATLLKSGLTADAVEKSTSGSKSQNSTGVRQLCPARLLSTKLRPASGPECGCLHQSFWAWP